MVLIRDSLNSALAIEGQHIAGDAPHAPLYFDYVDSDVSNGIAFKDADYSFIGVTVQRVFDANRIAAIVAYDDSLLRRMALGLDTNRNNLQALLLWMCIGMTVAHEYAHHTHGHHDHLVKLRASGATRMRQQACELDADGWAAYLTLE